MQAHGWRKKNIGGPGFRLIRKVLADLVKEVLVPCRRQGDAAREERGLGRSSVALDRQTKCSPDAHLGASHKDPTASTVRAITRLDGGDVLFRDGLGPPEICGRQERHLLDVSFYDPSQGLIGQANLFLQGQGGQLRSRQQSLVLGRSAFMEWATRG